jgi:ATP-dependent helicase/nuclease subunit A
VESVVRPPGRPAGRRFGTLVHEVLRDIDLSGDRDSVASMARMHGRLLGASAEEIDAAVEAVSAALAHPLLDRARSAERCHRELPVMLKLDANKLLEGAIDLAFLERGTWIILDFKTDADLPARQAHYRRQLLWYGLALAQTSRLPVRAWLLSV